MLDRLVELGQSLAEALQRQAAAGRGGGVDLPKSLARLDQEMRQIAALRARLDGKLDEERRLQERCEAEIAARQAEAVREHSRQEKLEAKRVIEEVIKCEAADKRRTEDVSVDLDERLDGEDDAVFGKRPLVEIVARICRELGIRPNPLPRRRQ